MSEIRDFIRSLGDQAPAFFQVKPALIKQWLKHGHMPLNKVDAAFAVMSHDAVTKAISEISTIKKVNVGANEWTKPPQDGNISSWTNKGVVETLSEQPFEQTDPALEVDPAVMEEQALPEEASRHDVSVDVAPEALPVRVPQAVAPAAIEQATREGIVEVDPYEQNAGSMIRPGRVAVPMQRTPPRIIQKRQSVSPQAQRVERDNTPQNVPVMTKEQYEAAMKKVKPHGPTNWAAPRPNANKAPLDGSKLAQRRTP